MENNKDKEEESEGKDRVEEIKSSKDTPKDVSRVASVMTHGKSPSVSESTTRQGSVVNGTHHVPYTAKHLDVAKNMEEIHQTFKTVVEEFTGDKASARLMVEYDKLYDYARTSHNEVHSWKLRCVALAEEVKLNTEKLNLAIHLSQEDRALISSLNKQSGDAWQMVDELHERERKAKETVSRMQDEVHLLTCMVENGMGLDELLKLSSKAGDELKSYEEANKSLKDELNMFESRYVELITKHNAKALNYEEIIKNLKHQNDLLTAKGEEDKELREDFQAQIYRLERTKLRLVGDQQRAETEVAANKMFIKKQGETITETRAEADILKQSLTKEKKSVKAGHKIQEEMKHKYEMLMKKFTATEEKLEAEKNTNHVTNNLLGARTKDLQMKEEEIKQLMKRMQAQSNELIKTKDNLNACGACLKMEENEARALEVNMNTAVKELDKVSASLKTTIGNYEGSQKALRRVKKQKQTVEEELVMAMEGNQRLYSDLSSAYRNVRVVVDKLNGCVNEKERLVTGLNVKTAEVAKLESEVSASALLNQMLEKTNTQLQVQVKEAVRSKTAAINERDSIQALLNKSELENNELRHANQNVLKQAKSLQNEVENKEHMYDKLTERFMKLRSQYDHLCSDLIHAEMDKDKLKSLLFQTELQLKNANNMIDNQGNIISDKNIKIKQLTSHRNILGATCVKNNTKIDMLLTKHELLEAILNNGNRLYEERMREIKLLHLTNANLLRQKDNIMKKLENIDQLKSRLSLANKELVNCQAHLRALEDQPAQNIHDWKAIKAKDYSKYELILKSNTLVKRLIIKTDEVTKLESALTDKAYILNHFKKLLARAPSTEVVVQATEDRKKKEYAQNKLKAALAEMNMLEWNNKEKERENRKMQIEIVEEKKKRIQVIRRGQSQVKKCEEKVTQGKRFLPPIINKGF